MSEYIEREAALKVVADIMQDCKVTHKHRALNRNIKQILPADVVEVVRCKDCEYSEIDENDNLWCTFYNEKIREMPNGYCWHGERRE